MVKQNDWATLHAKIKNCTECSLASTRHNAVCGEGNRQASIMFIAQAPGEKEDLKGRMFLGPSGKIFRELLQNIDLDLEKCYLTNLLKCRLPSNRRPRKDEIHQCATYLYHEIELVQPNLLVLLGYYATREIFRFYNLPIPERRKFRETTGKLYWQNIKIYPVIHPAAALHKSELLPVLQQNFQKIQVLQQSCFWLQECILRKFESSGVIGLYWKHHYCCGDWSRCQRYLRLNKHIPYPENLLPDGSCIEM